MLHWVASHFNPLGYERPQRNLERFVAGLVRQKVPGTLVSLTLGTPSLTSEFHSPLVREIHLSLPWDTPPFWWKEAMLNVGIDAMPPEVDKVAVLDADIEFLDDDWAASAAAALEIHPVIQPWHRVRYTTPEGRDGECRASTGYGCAHRSLDEWNQYHPGCAWAFRRSFLDAIGGWYVSPISHGDTLLALACTGRMDPTHPRLARLSAAHREDILQWALDIDSRAAGQIGYINGEIRHYWHGSLEDRRYADLPSLIQHYDPATDISIDPVTRLPLWSASALRDKAGQVAGIADYFRSRREDG